MNTRLRVVAIVLDRLRPPRAVTVACMTAAVCLGLASAATSAWAENPKVPGSTPIKLIGPLEKTGPVEPPVGLVYNDAGYFEVGPLEPVTAPAVLYTIEADAAASGQPTVMRASIETPILMSAVGKLEVAHPDLDEAIFKAMGPIGEALKQHDPYGLTHEGQQARLFLFNNFSEAEKELLAALSEAADDPNLTAGEADAVFQLGRGVKWEELSLDQRLNLPTDVLLDALEGVAPLPPSDLPPLPPLLKDPEAQPANAAAQIMTETQERNVELAEKDPAFAQAMDEVMHEVDSPSLPSVAATTQEDLEYASKTPDVSDLSSEIGTSPQDPVKLTRSGGLETTVEDLESLSDTADQQTTAVTKQTVEDVKEELAGGLKPQQLLTDATSTLSPELESESVTAQLADQALKDGTPGEGVSSKATGALGAAKLVTSDAVEETTAAVEEGAEDGAEAAIDAGEATTSVVDPLMLVQLATQLPQIITQIVQLIKGEPNFEQQVLSALGSIKEQIGALSEQVTEGFAYVDQTLVGIGTKIDQDTQLLEHVAANGGQLQSDLAEITGKLDQIQATLYRIAEAAREESLNTALNTYVGYNQRFEKELPDLEFAKALGIFFTWGDESSLNAVSEHKGGSTAPNQVAAELQGTEGANALNENLDYLASFADKAGWLDGLPALNENVPNPEVWATASNAYSQLLLENTGQVTEGVRSSLGELESVGQTLKPFIGEITEKGPAYAPMEVDGVKIDTGSSILDHALANYLDSAVAPTTGSGMEPSLVNRIRAQENSTLTAQAPGASDESYGHCSPCSLAVAPTAEVGNTGQALIDPWSGPSQTPAEGLPTFAAASDAAQKHSGGISNLAEMNLCRGFTESTLQVEESGEQEAGGLISLEPGVPAFGPAPPMANTEPLSALYANAWHLGYGRLISCYAADRSAAGIKTQVNYFWESPFSHTPLPKHLQLRITINYPFQYEQSPECDYHDPVEAMRELWPEEESIFVGKTTGEERVTGCEEKVTPLSVVYGRVTTYVHKKLEREGQEVEEGKKSGIASGTLNNAECRKETDLGKQPSNLGREGGAFECEVTIGSVPHVEHECGAFICDGESITEQVVEELSQLRRAVLKHVAEPSASESLNEEAPADVQAAAVRVNGARALLDDYIELGMPNAMTDDPRLRNFVLGAGSGLADLEKSGDHLLDNSPGAPNIYSIFTREIGEIESKQRPPALWPAAFPQEPCVEHCPAEVGLAERANPIAEQVIEEPERSPKRRNEHDGILPFDFKRVVEQLARRIHADLDTEATAAAEEPLVEAAATQLSLTRELLSIAPVNMGAPEVKGSPVAGETLSCSPGAWEARPSPTFSYSWLRDGASVGLGPSYLLTNGDVGQELACEVTAQIRGEAATATSAPVTVLAAVVPPASTLPKASTEVATLGTIITPGRLTTSAVLPRPNLTINATQKIKGSKAGFSSRELAVTLSRPGAAAGRRKRRHYTSQTLEYRITVTNTGNVPLALTNFSDPYCRGVSSSAPAGGQLKAGRTVVYSCQQTVSRDGTYLNQATIKAAPPLGDGFTLSRVSNETVALGPNPEPTAETGSATGVTRISALVTGRVNPHGRNVTSCTFEYWTTGPVHSAECAKPPGHGTRPVNVAAHIDSLFPGTTYHYRLAAGNPTGTSRGNAKELTTPAAPEATT